MSYTAQHCGECGAYYERDDDSCATRFAHLLALDHSRREPWGSRHGQAFCAYALQHPGRHATSLDAAWSALYRIYVLGVDPAEVFESLRNNATGRPDGRSAVPHRPATRRAMPDMTIADLGDFDAASYPARLNAWCRAALRSWGPFED
jgi:hypothetical protein